LLATRCWTPYTIQIILKLHLQVQNTTILSGRWNKNTLAAPVLQYRS
jgi:hypothetical protein